jgi:antitoxin VapB
MNEVKQLNIKNAEAYDLASEIAELTGESLTAVVKEALREKAARERKLRDREGFIRRLKEITDAYAALPNSGLTEDEILGYDKNGLPT